MALYELSRVVPVETNPNRDKPKLSLKSLRTPVIGLRRGEEVRVEVDADVAGGLHLTRPDRARRGTSNPGEGRELDQVRDGRREPLKF